MQKILGISAAILGTILLAGSVLATGATTITNPPTGASGSPVLTISYQVINNEDSGLNGYWALDSYTKTITIWKDANFASNHQYDAYASYSGTFCTFEGAKSPVAGVIEPNDGCGTMTGAADFTFTYSGEIDNTYIPDAIYDLGGSKEDILSATPSGGQRDRDVTQGILSGYFPSCSPFVYTLWSWTYSLPNGAVGGTQWIDDVANERIGDIVTSSSNVVVASVDVPQATCGITVSGTLAFGPVNQGTESAQQFVTVTNVGTVPTTSFTVAGTIWAGVYGNTMPVGQTKVYDGTWYSLPSTPGTLFGGIVPANSGSVTPYFTVTIPTSQPGDTYSQVITFNAGC